LQASAGKSLRTAHGKIFLLTNRVLPCYDIGNPFFDEVNMIYLSYSKLNNAAMSANPNCDSRALAVMDFWIES